MDGDDSLQPPSLLSAARDVFQSDRRQLGVGLVLERLHGSVCLARSRTAHGPDEDAHAPTAGIARFGDQRAGIEGELGHLGTYVRHELMLPRRPPREARPRFARSSPCVGLEVPKREVGSARLAILRAVKILILGGDGYLGWPTAMHFSAAGHEVA